jgi:hypothetical protein
MKPTNNIYLSRLNMSWALHVHVVNAHDKHNVFICYEWQLQYNVVFVASVSLRNQVDGAWLKTWKPSS